MELIEPVRIATWPVNSVEKRLPYLLHWLGNRQPDIVALQKIHGTAESFPAPALSCAGYYAEPFPPSFACDFGVAILIRKPLPQPRILQRGLPCRQEDGARLLTVEVGNHVFASVYVPADRQKRIPWLKDFSQYIENELDSSNPILLCGDFNINENRATKKERKIFNLLFESGYIDLYRHRYPHDDGFNFGRNSSKPVTSRLNRILGTESIAATLQRAWVDLQYRGPISGLKDETWTKSAPLIVEFG